MLGPGEEGQGLKIALSGLEGGRIVGADEGRAVFFGASEAFEDLAAELGGADGPASPELVAASTAVLARWSRDWRARPTIVVPCPSLRPTRTATLAAGIGQVGHLPVTPSLLVGTPPQEGRDAAPVERVRGLFEDLACSAAEVLEPGAVVLLVADRARSGWTIAVAAHLLRQAGAECVLPLVGQLLP